MNTIRMIMGLATLILSSTPSMFFAAYDQKELLYTLHRLGQNLAEVPKVVQDVDGYLAIIAMDAPLTQAELKAADQQFVKILLRNAAVFAGCYFTKTLLPGCGVVCTAGQLIVAVDTYLAWRKRATLSESLALDRAILAQLQEIKRSRDCHN